VKHKGHFSTEEWADSNYGNFTYESINPKNNYNPSQIYEQQKNSEFTTVYVSASNYPANTQLDFRVEADLYYEGQFRVYYDWLDFTGFMINGYIIDQDSGWSSTQTIDLDAIPQFTSEYIILVVVFIVITVLAVALVLSRRKRA
jgi:hypothetical protein